MAEESTDTVEQTDAGEVSNAGPVILADRYTIDPASPLKELNTPSAKAYAAKDKRDPDGALYALICPPYLPPRTGAMQIMKGSNIRGALSVVDYGSVHWPQFNQKTIAVIYKRPTGGRLIDHLHEIQEHEIVRKIVEPIAHGMQEIATRGVAHRQIRPSNLYFMDGTRDRLTLGDCTTVPSGYDQPALFEPIERGCTPPSGRGQGDVTDDLYALGVTLMYVLARGNPVPHLRTEEQMLAAKMTDGSFTTLVGKESVSLVFLEPLRGLLSDDAHERWGLEQLDLWVNGRRMTPIQKRAGQKAHRPVVYNGKEYFSPRTLALAINRQPGKVHMLLKDGVLENWLRRDLDDPDKSNAVSNAVHMAQAFANDNDYLAARVAMVLDSNQPMSFKEFSCMPDGFGSALAYHQLHKGNAQPAVEMVIKGVPRNWFDQQEVYNPVFVALEKNFDQLANFLKAPEIGYGLERCLYETNSTLPCQSPLIVDEYVVDIKELLPALEIASNKVDPKKQPMDRHIAAFIAARINQKIDSHLKALADPKEEISTLGMLSLLALVQWHTKTPSLLGLASWLGAHMGPAIKAYHSRSVRRELEKEVPKMVRKGNLSDLFALLDDAEKRREDTNAFTLAQDEYHEAATEIQDIEAGALQLKENSARVGQQAAATTSIVLALIIIVIVFLSEAL